MSKALIWFLNILGFFVLVVGLLISEGWLQIFGLLLIVLGLFLAFRPGGILRKEQVIESWATMIENAHGNAAKVIAGAEALVRSSQVPSLFLEKEELAPGIIRGLFGAKREYLVVSDKGNFRMGPYQILMNARDYGNHLDVSWHLTFRPTFWQAIPALLPLVSLAPKGPSDLDLFDQQDLRAYATIVHHGLLQSVEAMMVELSQDTSRIDRKSKGFLGIS